MRVNHSNVHTTLKPVRPAGFVAPNSNNDLSSIGTRSGRVNIGQIHQFQSSHISGASKQETAVLRHATSAHTAANAKDPVVMNILKRTQASRPVSPQEQKLLEARLLSNEKLLARLNSHKHASDVSYQLEVEKNGNSFVEELIHGRPVVHDPSVIGGRSSYS